MISCLVFERPGRWGAIGLITIISLMILPALPLLWHTLPALSISTQLIPRSFLSPLWNSIAVALIVILLSLLIGLPAGVVTGLYDFPGRAVFLAFVSLPLVVPSFLWSIGWSYLSTQLSLADSALFSGVVGCVITFTAAELPLVLFSSFVTVRGLSGSQIDSARLAGGENTLLHNAARYALIPAILAASLGGVLTLSEPGPGQILGLRTAAGEILTSFSALYDFQSAGLQCLFLSGLILLGATPLAILAAPRIARAILARQLRAPQPLRCSLRAMFAIYGLLAIILSLTLPALIGLSLPLQGWESFAWAGADIKRTAGNTLFYAVGSGLFSAGLGFILAFCSGRSMTLTRIYLGIAFAIFSLPGAFTALGLVQLATDAPAWADPLLRSRVTVCLALGLRFFPVAAVLCLRARAAMSPSWAFAASLHGIPFLAYSRRILIPYFLPSLGIAALIVGLLALADVGTTLLLHPPGAASLPLAIATVMANAPESLVSSLCVLYVLLAAGILAVIWLYMAKRRS